MLKRLLLAMFLALPLAAQSLEQKIYESSVVVFSEQAHSALRAICTGAAIAKSGDTYTVLTAAHCVATINAQGDTVPYSHKIFINSTINPRGRKEAQIALLGDLRRGEDYALITAESSEPLQLLTIQREPRTPFEEIFAVGTPFGIGKLFFRGWITEPASHPTIYQEHVFIVQLPGIAPGNSGGPVVCRSTGKICGILVGVIEESRLGVVFDMAGFNIGQ